MYTFLDRGEESLTLRPEATASVIRAYLEHTIHAAETVTRLFTIGPMFRRERPQKGRYRQFHQIDAEILGPDDPRTDAELILMLIHFLDKLGLAKLNLEINSLGCANAGPPSARRSFPFLAVGWKSSAGTASGGSGPTRCVFSTARWTNAARSSPGPRA